MKIKSQAFISVSFVVSLFATIIPSDRRTFWDQVGMLDRSGIPPVPIVFTNFSPGVTIAQLNNALSICPSNQAVKLASGNYSFSSQITWVNNGAVLRGAGRSNTFISFPANAGQANIEVGQQTIDRTAPPAGQIINWTNGYGQFTNTIYLSSVAGLSVGHLLVLDQLNDNVVVDDDIQEGCDYCGRSLGERSQAQYVIITNITGNAVSFGYPGLHMPNWRSSMTPQVFYWTEADTTMAGIEDMAITNGVSAGLYGIEFSQSHHCWVKGVDLYTTPQAAISSSQSAHLDYYDVRMLSEQGGGNLSYGIIFYMASDSIMHHCVAANITAGMVFAPQASGNVVAYNFFTNAVYTPSNWDIASLSSHDAHVNMNLVEGNWANKMYIDSIHGSESHITLARNFFHGHQTNRVNNTMAFVAEQFCLSNNLVGNILGSSNFHDTILVTNGTQYAASGNTAIYILGNFDSVTGVPWDTRVAPSTLLHGNWQTVSGVQTWDAGIADHTIPDSYYLSSAPTNNASLAWPKFDATTPTKASTDPTNLWAGYVFLFGSNPPLAAASATTTNSFFGTGKLTITGKVIIQ